MKQPNPADATDPAHSPNADAPSIANAYAAKQCNDIAARTDGRTYVDLLNLRSHLTLSNAHRGG